MKLYHGQQTEGNPDRKHQFLLTFFDKPYKVDHKEINGYVLQSYFSNSTKYWEVMIYTRDSWDKAQFYVLKNHPERLKDPKRKTKFKKLFDELQTAVQHNSK